MKLTGHGYLQFPQEIVDESENSGRLRETQEGSSRSPAVEVQNLPWQFVKCNNTNVLILHSSLCVTKSAIVPLSGGLFGKRQDFGSHSSSTKTFTRRSEDTSKNSLYVLLSCAKLSQINVVSQWEDGANSIGHRSIDWTLVCPILFSMVLEPVLACVLGKPVTVTRVGLLRTCEGCVRADRGGECEDP